MIGNWLAARNAQIAQQNQMIHAQRLAEYNREQTAYHEYIVKKSYLGPVRYKVGPWSWTVEPCPGTVLRRVVRS